MTVWLSAVLQQPSIKKFTRTVPGLSCGGALGRVDLLLLGDV